MTWNFHADDYSNGRYDMILGRDILTYLGLNLKLFEHVIKSYDGTFKVLTAPMVDLRNYSFKYLNIGKIKTE